jgi:hypothetical protein
VKQFVLLFSSILAFYAFVQSMAVEGAMIETARGEEGSADRHETTITIAFWEDVMLGV